MCYFLLKDELYNVYIRVVLVKLVKGIFVIVEVMIFGIGLVVLFILRFIICVFGYFSKCVDFFFVICLYFLSERSVI